MALGQSLTGAFISDRNSNSIICPPNEKMTAPTAPATANTGASLGGAARTAAATLSSSAAFDVAAAPNLPVYASSLRVSAAWPMYAKMMPVTATMVAIDTTVRGVSACMVRSCAGKRRSRAAMAEAMGWGRKGARGERGPRRGGGVAR